MDSSRNYAALSLHQNIPSTQGMWGFQLIGQTALNNTNNSDAMKGVFLRESLSIIGNAGRPDPAATPKFLRGYILAPDWPLEGHGKRNNQGAFCKCLPPV
jgi:hypothetical protein